MAIPPPLTDAQVQAQVEAQVASEIAAAEGPLQGQIAGTEARQKEVAGQIGQYFGNIMPFVQQSAQAVASDYSKAEQAQSAIFQTAQQRLNDLANSRAADAQRLAQEMGGPVAVSEFMAPVKPFQQTAPFEFAGGLLSGLAEAQAGNQQAQAWSGRVFPAMQTEQQAQARNFYEGRIKEIQDQISQIESQRGSLINSRVADRLIAERNYALDAAKLELDKANSAKDNAAKAKALKLQQIKDNRDWLLEKAQNKRETKQINRNYRLQRSQITGFFEGKPTLAERTRRTADKLANRKVTQQGLRDRASAAAAVSSLNERIAHDQATERAAVRRGDQAAAKNARQARKAKEDRRQRIRENAAIDPGKSKVQGYLVDKLGRPVLDKRGRKQKVQGGKKGMDDLLAKLLAKPKVK